MKAINHNTTNLLFEKAEELSQQPHESWRCVHFRFSERPEKKNHTLYDNFVVKAIFELMADSTGFIYLCDDADIVILFQGALKPVLTRLSGHFADIDPEQQAGGDNDLVSIFDLSKQWDDFYSVCESKYLRGIVFEEEGLRHQHYRNRYM